MKNIIAGLLLLAPAIVQAQISEANTSKPNAWRTFVTVGFFGQGDTKGITIMNEYIRYLKPHIKAGPNIKFSSVSNLIRYKSGLNNQDDDFTYYQTNIFEVGAMGYYEYLNMDRSGLELGLGIFYRHLRHTVATGPNTEFLGPIRVPESGIGQWRENTVGFNVYIGFVIHISQTVKLNLGGLLQHDTGDNTGLGASAGLTIRF